MVNQASRLADVRYDIRGPVLRRARALEADGHEIIKLNIGNPAPFGLFTPDAVLSRVTSAIADSQGYSDARGIAPAREAVASYYRRRLGVPSATADDVFLGNGVSELIVMTLQALLNPGDEVLVPVARLPAVDRGGLALRRSRRALPVRRGPRLEPRRGARRVAGHRADQGACHHQPEQPDRRRLLARDAARAARHRPPPQPAGPHRRDLRPDRLRRRGAPLRGVARARHPGASRSAACPRRTGWPGSAPAGWWSAARKEPIAEYLEGLELLANMRMCPNVPAQHAIPAALDGGIDITPLLAPGGRLRDQRDRAWELLTAIDGVDCYQPAGALYLFPRLDPEVHKIVDDQRMCIDLLEQQHVLLTHGTGFNLPSTDHIRIVFLAPVETLTEAIGRLGEFLSGYRQ